MARKSNETLTLIEEITRNDGSKYYEISNMVQNGRAELAAIRGMIKEVRIIHGYGSGQLKTAIHNHLKNIKFVKSFRLCNELEGGGGATLVTLK